MRHPPRPLRATRPPRGIDHRAGRRSGLAHLHREHFPGQSGIWVFTKGCQGVKISHPVNTTVDPTTAGGWILSKLFDQRTLTSRPEFRSLPAAKASTVTWGSAFRGPVLCGYRAVATRGGDVHSSNPRSVIIVWPGVSVSPGNAGNPGGARLRAGRLPGPSRFPSPILWVSPTVQCPKPWSSTTTARFM